MQSIAQGTIAKARILLNQARVAVLEWPVFEANFEAAIVLARSVTFHVQKEYAHAPGFEAWWSDQQAALAGNPLARFFLETRNYILKEGPPALMMLATVQLEGGIMPTGTVSVRAIRSQPEEGGESAAEPADEIEPAADKSSPPHKRSQREVLHELTQMQEVPGTASAYYQFFDTQWGAQDATQLLSEYLDVLERVAIAAEDRFVDIDNPSATTCPARR